MLIPCIWCSVACAIPIYALSNPTNELYLIDTESLGTPTLVGDIGFGDDLTELVGASSDVLYTFDRTSNTLVSIATSTAEVLGTTSIDTTLGLPNPRGFDIGADDVLYGIFPGLELRSIDPLTGATELVSTFTGVIGIEAIAFGPDGTLYVAGSESTTNAANRIYTADVMTGALSLVGNTGLFDIDALMFGSDGFLYGVDSNNFVQADLFRIDVLTASATNLGNSGVFGFNGITGASVSVPEPGTLALLTLGLLGMGLARKRTA